MAGSNTSDTLFETLTVSRGGKGEVIDAHEDTEEIDAHEETELGKVIVVWDELSLVCENTLSSESDEEKSESDLFKSRIFFFNSNM